MERIERRRNGRKREMRKGNGERGRRGKEKEWKSGRKRGVEIMSEGEGNRKETKVKEWMERGNKEKEW